AMPFSQPRTLTGDEVYAATAYLLWLNKIVGENDTMDAKTLPKVKMPNRDGFIIRFPDKTERRSYWEITTVGNLSRRARHKVRHYEKESFQNGSNFQSSLTANSLSG